MEQLLEFRTVPIDFEFRIKPARTERKNPQSSVQIQRDRGSLSVDFKPGRLTMDSFEMRSSLGLKSVPTVVREARQRGIQAAYEATANFVEEGNMLMDIHQRNSPIPDIAFQRMQPQFDSMLGFSPSQPLNIDWQPHSFAMRYQMDQLNFQWRTNHETQASFEPAKLEYVVKQYPKLEVKYLGRPIYVPPSADPEYEPKPFDVLV